MYTNYFADPPLKPYLACECGISSVYTGWFSESEKTLNCSNACCRQPISFSFAAFKRGQYTIHFDVCDFCCRAEILRFQRTEIFIEFRASKKLQAQFRKLSREHTWMYGNEIFTTFRNIFSAFLLKIWKILGVFPSKKNRVVKKVFFEFRE